MTSCWASMSPARSSTADGVYNLESEGKTYDAAGFSAFLTELVDAYPDHHG